jgi:putative transposase
VNRLEPISAERGAPTFIKMDYGPEFAAYAIIDWCEFSGSGAIFIDPGSPRQNKWIKSLKRPAV